MFAANVRNFLILAITLASICEIRSQQSPLLSALVPKIVIDNYKLEPEEIQYRLKIQLLNGSTRDELVELKSTGTPEQELSVDGTYKTYYPDKNGVLIVTYTAGSQGYVAKYKYTVQQFTIQSISPNALKSAAG